MKKYSLTTVYILLLFSANTFASTQNSINFGDLMDDQIPKSKSGKVSVQRSAPYVLAQQIYGTRKGTEKEVSAAKAFYSALETIYKDTPDPTMHLAQLCASGFASCSVREQCYVFLKKFRERTAGINQKIKEPTFLLSMLTAIEYVDSSAN